MESYDLTIGVTKSPGVIGAVSSLEMIYDKYGYHVLDRTLRLCVGAWEGDVNSLSANILKGIARLIVAFGDTMRDDLFKEKVGVVSIKDLSRTAKERKAGSLGYAEAMLIAYNRKFKSPLKWAKLYEYQTRDDSGEDDAEAAEEDEQADVSERDE